MKNCYTIFTKWVAEEIYKQGFKFVDLKPNVFDKRYNVYYFEYSKELVTAVKQLRKRKNYDNQTETTLCSI